MFLFYDEFVCCVYSLESPQRGDSNEYSQHIIIEDRKKASPKSSPFASWSGTMVNAQWLELPMSRTHFPGPHTISVELLLKCPGQS